MNIKSLLKNKSVEFRQIITILVFMAIVCLVASIYIPNTYFTLGNFKSMMFQFPEYGILAFGMMICMISGGIDLSLVGIMNLSGMSAALVVIALVPNEADVSVGYTVFALIIACITALVVGALCGLFNGFIIGYLKIPAMLVTLCSLQLFTGIVYGVTGGNAINGMCKSFSKISNDTIPGTMIPWVLPIFLVIMVIMGIILHKTKLGKEIFYLGSNAKVSVYSGLDTVKTTIKTHMISGLLGGVSGILITSHLNAAKSSSGASYTLLTILIVVLGGVNPKGGRGNIFGVSLSVFLMQMISNLFTLLHISQDVKNFANGLLLVVILVVVMLLEYFDKKRKKKEQQISKEKLVV